MVSLAETPLTGKPDAGNPPVRFGGRGSGNAALPTPIYRQFRDARVEAKPFSCLPAKLARAQGISSAQTPGGIGRSQSLQMHCFCRALSRMLFSALMRRETSATPRNTLHEVAFQCAGIDKRRQRLVSP